MVALFWPAGRESINGYFRSIIRGALSTVRSTHVNKLDSFYGGFHFLLCGGSQGIECTDSKTVRASAELLDLFERGARSIFVSLA